MDLPRRQLLISVEKFRKIVRERFSSEIESGEDFDPNDLKRFQENDDYTNTFIRHGQFGTTFNQERALRVFEQTLRWRKEKKVFEISSTDFPQDFFQRGAIFYRNFDLRGNRLLHFVIRNFVKGRDDNEAVKRFITFNFEEHIRTKPEQQVVIIFDMSSTGLGNIDYDLVKFIMDLLTHKYPGFLAYMLVFKMPFILQAAWVVVRSWLSTEAQEFVKFVNESTIRNYVATDQLFVSMGGTDPGAS